MRPENVSTLLFVMPQPVPVNVIVPAVGASVWLAFTVKVPDTLKFPVGCTVGVVDIVRPLNVSVPLLDMVHAALFIVTVPDVGAKVVLPLTVSVPPILKLAVG